MEAPANELRCRVTGHVQGVAYRAFVAGHASELGLVGYVRNESDGSVTVVAQGPAELLEELLLHLHSGPCLSRVETVEPTWHTPSGRFSEFAVR